MVPRWRIRWFIFLALAAAALAACGGSPAAQEARVPAAVATAVPLDQVELEPLLIQTGDLPSGMSGGQVTDKAPKMFDGMPQAQRTISQQLAQGEKQIGGVTAFLYQESKDRDAAYQFILDGMGQTDQAEGVGEQARVTKPNKDAAAIGLNFADVVFQRCHALVYIRMSGTALEPSAAIAYAKRLDKRLRQVVC